MQFCAPRGGSGGAARSNFREIRAWAYRTDRTSLPPGAHKVSGGPVHMPNATVVIYEFAPPGADPGEQLVQTFAKYAPADAGSEKHHFDQVRTRYRGAVRGSKIHRSVQRASPPFHPGFSGENQRARLDYRPLLRGNLVCAPGGATRRGSRSNFHRRRVCRCRSRKTSLRLCAGKISRGCPRVENSKIRSASRFAISAGFTRGKQRAPRSSDSAATGKF